MWRTTILVVAIAACGKGGGDAPTSEMCTAFIAHAANLEANGGADKMPMFKYSGTDDAEAKLWREGCPKQVTRTQIECAMKATDLAGLDKCVDREALDDKLGG